MGADTAALMQLLASPCIGERASLATGLSSRARARDGVAHGGVCHGCQEHPRQRAAGQGGRTLHSRGGARCGKALLTSPVVIFTVVEYMPSSGLTRRALYMCSTFSLYVSFFVAFRVSR